MIVELMDIPEVSETLPATVRRMDCSDLPMTQCQEARNLVFTTGFMKKLKMINQ